VDKIRVVQYGCGPIGVSIVKLMIEKHDVQIVGAIDIDESKAGRDLGDVIGMAKPLGTIISNNAKNVLNKSKPDCVLHATTSSLKNAYPQFEECIVSGANVISTCEELSYPYRKQLDLAAAIDNLAKEHRVTILGTGVNPGFLMDAWPLFMTAVCQQVKQIRVTRVQNASQRRLPFQKKIGAGCTLNEFRRLVDTNKVRHVGLAESIAMIAAGLGWSLDDITENLEPIITETEVRSELITVKPGQVAGVRQVGRGFKATEEVITLDFQAALGAKESYDAVYITGIPNMKVVIEGGTNGDIATAAIVVNSIPRVMEAPPGLITMKDLPLVSAY
jgi:4-hydroxy-tetrahydrodipicolinate reductase